jgi:hypothetical protein
MKSNYLKNAVLSLGLISFMGIAACSSGDKKHATSEADGVEQENAAESAMPSFAEEKVGLVYSDYITLKDALIESDEKNVGITAGALQASLSETSHKAAADLAAKIASASSLKAQREPFNDLSIEMEKILKAAELSGGTIYKQYCPMANNDDGGYWFANEKSIRNPYYGDEMMTCGSVKEEIK